MGITHISGTALALSPPHLQHEQSWELWEAGWGNKAKPRVCLHSRNGEWDRAEAPLQLWVLGCCEWGCCEWARIPGCSLWPQATACSPLFPILLAGALCRQQCYFTCCTMSAASLPPGACLEQSQSLAWVQIPPFWVAGASPWSVWLNSLCLPSCPQLSPPTCLCVSSSQVLDIFEQPGGLSAQLSPLHCLSAPPPLPLHHSFCPAGHAALWGQV